MLPRAIWKGAISFGMVVIPIKLSIATESREISFALLHSACNTLLRRKRYCPFHEAEVEQITGPFEPERYQDEYWAALERVIEAKLGTAQPAVAAPPSSKGQVRDLVEGLKASIEAAKRERAGASAPLHEARARRRARQVG